MKRRSSLEKSGYTKAFLNAQPTELHGAGFATSAAEENRFLKWWLKNGNAIIECANQGDEMFIARRVARTAWHAAMEPLRNLTSELSDLPNKR